MIVIPRPLNTMYNSEVTSLTPNVSGRTDAKERMGDCDYISI